jgi:hypothetical protein
VAVSLSIFVAELGPREIGIDCLKCLPRQVTLELGERHLHAGEALVAATDHRTHVKRHQEDAEVHTQISTAGSNVRRIIISIIRVVL